MDGVMHPSVEQAIGRDRIRKAFKRYENNPVDEHDRGIVRAVNADGSYEVLLDGDVQTARCAPYAKAMVGDRVIVVTTKDGENVLLGRLGGEIGGGGEIVTTVNDASNYVAGKVFAHAGTNDPAGALLCDGRAVSRREYWELFDAIGTTYGAGDGSSTFNLPNIESRTIIGESDSYALGATGGQESVTLTAAIGAASNATNVLGYITDNPSGFQRNNNATYVVSGSNGGFTHWNHGTPVTDHNSTDRETSLMQPYIVMRYFITTGKGDPVSGINPADYVVEWGVDDFWTWFKYASGKAECWNTHENVVTFPAGSSVTNHNLPFQFADNDYRVYTYKSTAPGYSSSQIEHITITPTSEGVVGFVLENWNAHTEQRVFSVSIEVIGRWKEMSESGGTESIAPTIAERFEGIESEIDLLKTSKVLWSGVSYMEDWATATLSEPVSAQPNGIVLVWSYYNNGAAVDDIWTTHPISKEFVARHEGNGYSAGAITAAGPYLKHVYIADTTIRGWANNSVTGTTGNVTVYNNYFVLRYVLGV